MEPIILIVLVVLVVLVLLGRGGSLSGLVVNGIVGVVLLFLTRRSLTHDEQSNTGPLFICGLGYVAGWLVILILHLLGKRFSVCHRCHAGRQTELT